MSKKVKLCDGFTVLKDGRFVMETKYWQKVREYLNLDPKGKLWSDITRLVYCFGFVDLDCHDDEGRGSVVHIAVIPCRD